MLSLADSILVYINDTGSHCQAINQLWNEIKNDILICFNVNIRMSEQIVLFGVLTIEGASRSC